MEAFVFSILPGVLAWWVCPFQVAILSFHSQWLMCDMQDFSDANTCIKPGAHMIKLWWKWVPFRKIESLFAEKDQASCSLLRGTYATVCPMLGHVCMCGLVCSSSEVQQMPQLEMSLKCVPYRQLAPPYLAVAVPHQLASNQYLLQPAMNPYRPPPHLCSAT